MAKRIGLLIAGLLAALAIGEVITRLSGRAPEMSLISVGRFQLSANPRMGYEPVPDFEYHGRKLYYYEFRGRSNRLGFRDRDHPVQKPAGTFRILVLGDSITMGLELERTEDIFTFVLERALREKGYAADVLNFGVSGYNTQQEVEMLADKGLAFQPDLVVLAYCLNDTLQMNGGIIRRLRERESEAAGIAHYQLTPRLARSALYRLIWARFFAERLVEDRVQHYRDLKADTVEPSLKKLRRLADEQGFEVLVAVLPTDKTRGSPEQY
ncbi:MAG: SGNH/GDSL hydrolase family protein, partial [Verrucomicrobia bacterium]|nr:SGNH/GDSL hydrolase family protein [Verrucomicrobiota bacterium]